MRESLKRCECLAGNEPNQIKSVPVLGADSTTSNTNTSSIYTESASVPGKFPGTFSYNKSREYRDSERKRLTIHIDDSLYREYRKLDYTQRRLVQAMLRKFLSSILEKGVPDLRVEMNQLVVNIDTVAVQNIQKIVVTETCRDVAEKLKKYKDAVKCVQSLSSERYASVQTIKKCVEGLNPYRD